ncbi:hypothetical protein [Mucilaginibacter gotjawali]|uniref:Uncharacterized protein n=2 Tax=Mucilaginibacter gotjawali TaxID=1550579 RepID=A0A110B231_9SPHI|nr:hypothetical protein [Mucilaginibacter gotjawali]MBB3055494.1 hypothetical protein [Mucilaginibacter gotjawali]BAU53227.1 hypothetical protein MgSA37_01394 [Mucilaginibacter gotjawali]
MIKTIFNNKWFQYYLPVSLSLFMLFTEKRAVAGTDGGYDRLFGFPFPYISNNFGCTGCFDVYTGALILDFSIYLLLILLIFKGTEKLGFKLKIHWAPTITGLLISGFWIFFFCMITQDSKFKLINDIDYKTTHIEFVFNQFP